MNEKLAILDCGGQYTKVIDRKIREAGVYTDILPMNVPAEKLASYGAVILSGGPSSVWESNAPEYDKRIFDLGVPMLGICYGMQLIVEHFHGVVAPLVKTEYGQTEVRINPDCPLFAGLDTPQLVLMSHGDAVSKIPEGFLSIAQTGSVCAGVWCPERNLFGVQFHPEVEPTVNGLVMLENFVRGICKFKEVYALEDRIQTSINMIQSRVGKDEKVVVLVSGGVDSAVTAALLVKALDPDQVYAIHIDHGLMRLNESDRICENLKKLGLKHMKRINAEDAFFHTPLQIDGVSYPPLCEVTKPEDKRAIIGQMFFRVTEEAAQSIHLDFDHAFLAQGTLRPDLIESGNPDVSSHAHKIKTHHNDVSIIRALRDHGKVIETNWDWHKDEVRKVARMLGLDEEIASRQPFPGPGLGVRILCADPNTYADKAKDAETKAYVRSLSSDYAAYLAPIQSVGVQGDNRSYRSLCILSGSRLDCDWDVLFHLAKEIPNHLDYINRVVYTINKSSLEKPLHTLYSRICHNEAELLRQADAIVTGELLKPMAKSEKTKIAQCFSVLLPVSENTRFSLAIRAVVTSDYMTAQAARPGVDFPADALSSILVQLEKAQLPIDSVFYDLTGKPPATVEYE